MTQKKTNNKSIAAPSSGAEPYQFLFQHHPIPMWVYDMKTLAFLEVNEAAVEKYGFTRDEFLQMTLKDILQPDEAPRLFEDVQKKRPEQHDSLECQHMLKNGRIIDVEIMSHTLEFNGAKVVLAVSYDITERKQAELVRKRADEELVVFRTLVDQSNDAFEVIDLETGRFLDCNEKACLDLGYSRDEFLNLSVTDIDARVNQSLFRQTAEQLRKSGSLLMESIHRRKDGSTFPVEINLKHVRLDREYVVIVARNITERKQSEDALRKSEMQYRHLIETMQDGVYRSSHEGKFLEVNPAMVKILRYDNKEELMAIDIKSQLYFAPADRESAALEEKLEEMAIFRLRRKDGSEVWVEDHGRHVVDDKGNVLYHEGVLRDITERQRAEEALQASEVELRSLFAAMNDVVLILDSEGRYLKIGPTNPNLLYKPADELIGKTIHEIFPKQQADFFVGHIRNCLGKKTITHVDYSITIGGNEVYFYATVSPMTENSVFWVGRDITERKRAEEALRESEIQYRQLIETMQDGVYRSSHEGKFLEVNPAMVKILGYDNKEELMAIDIKSQLYFAPADRESAALDEKLEEMAIFRLRRKDGSEVWVEDHGRHVVDSEGNVLYHEGVLRDITERNQAEEALRTSEKRFRNLFENSPISLWEEDFSEVKKYLDDIRTLGVSDFHKYFQEHPEELGTCAAKTKIVDINQATLKLYRAGSKAELLAGLSKVFGKESYAVFAEELVAVAEGKFGFESEAINMTLTGEKIHIILKWLIAPGYETTLSKVFISIINITERKVAEEALLSREAYLSAIIENQPGLTWLKDRENRFLAANHAFAVSCGRRTPGEIVGKTDFDVWPSDMAEKYLADDTRVMQTGHSISVEEIIYDRGEAKWFETCKTPVKDASGRIMGTTGFSRDITEHKLAEEMLQKSEQRHRDIFTYAPVGIYQSARNGDIMTANERLAQILGYDSVEELLHRNLARDVYFNENERESVLAMFEPHGVIQNLELQWKKKNGAPIWINLDVHGIQGRSENMGAYEGFVQDISERKRAEIESNVLFEIIQGITTTVNLDELLHLIHQSLKKVLYGENCFVALHDPITGLFSFPYFVDQFDTAPSPQSLGKSCSAFVFRTGTPMLITQKDFEHLEHLGEVENIGTPSPEWLGVPLRTPSKIIGVLVLQQYENKPTYTKRDIDFLTSVGSQIAVAIERKRAEGELSTLAHALRSIGECVSITDMDNTLLFVNEAFVKTYGYDEQELLGKHINIVWSEINPRELALEIHDTTLSGGWRGELFNRRKDGNEFPVFLSTSIIRDDKGQPLALIGVATDITESKNAEEKRKSLEAQLQQSQKLESLGTLASGIAHDFNNILGIIIGHASLLERLPANPATIKKNTEAITKASKRGAALVKQLLTFARKSDILVESVQLNTVVVEVSKLLSETFPKTITLSLNLEKQLPSIIADATQVHQVILNLCVNARDAMPDGGTLAIETFIQQGELIRKKFPKAEAKEYIGLRVSDTGTGMDDTTLRRIFEPFFTTKGIGKGTGLGLSLVFGIVESHSGFIDVQSEPGNGTTFLIYFPIPQQFIEDEAIKEQSSGEIPGGSETILLIEDEEMLRDLVQGILGSKGYTILTAEDGEEGVRQYEKHQQEIHLILSDLGLPKLNGFEAFKRMKTIKPDIKFIIASGFIEPEDKATMLTAGINNIIHKPYSVEEMLRAVRSLLDSVKG